MSWAPTRLIQLTPMAMRKPVKIDGRVVGRTTCVSSRRRLAPNDRAARTWSLSSDRTPAIVLTRIAKKADRKVMKTIEIVPIPKHRIDKGTQASSGGQPQTHQNPA